MGSSCSGVGLSLRSTGQIGDLWGQAWAHLERDREQEWVRASPWALRLALGQLWDLTHPPLSLALSFLVTHLFSQVTSCRTLDPQRLKGRLCALGRVLRSYSLRVPRGGDSDWPPSSYRLWREAGGSAGPRRLAQGQVGGRQQSRERLVGEAEESGALLLPGAPCFWQELLGLARSSLEGLSQWSSPPTPGLGAQEETWVPSRAPNL